MIPSRDNPDYPLGSPVAALPAGLAVDGAGAGSPLGLRRQEEDAWSPFAEFADDKPNLASSANVAAMKAAAWLATGLDRLLGARAHGRMGILTYHRVSPLIPGFPPPTHNVPPGRFRGHLAGLLDRGFTIWPLGELLRYSASGRPTPPRTIALTFDDGFQSVYTDAWPVLREFHAPATIFIATAYLGGAAPFPFDTWGWKHRDALPPASYRPLTVEQCREMLDGGLIDLGAHTHTHRDLRDQPDTFREDLQISVDYLRSTWGLTDVTFAFPFGARHSGFAGPRLVTAAKRTGVNCGLTTDCRLIDSGSDPFEWGRFNVFPWDTAATLVAKLDGWYTWAASVKHFLRRMRTHVQQNRRRRGCGSC
jgi:peptidoglycan/xylan/chitin deacetylase (PgdA/CDA1 family)